MLSLLHIENIAVIESADISFDQGFNVLTGETGAGKSIVIDAISAILGAHLHWGLHLIWQFINRNLSEKE